MKADSDWQNFANSLGIVRLVLLVDWDPIGIFGIPEAMDEYDTYAVNVHNMLATGTSQEDLVSYMRFVQSQLMGVRGSSDPQLLEVAAKIQTVFENATEE